MELICFIFFQILFILLSLFVTFIQISTKITIHKILKINRITKKQNFFVKQKRKN